MSIYNFNGKKADIQANHSGPSAKNGVQAGYSQVDRDLYNRNLGTTNHTEISVQLTRPTSKTAMLVRQRRAMLEQLSCFICKGYLIDATTLDECMDSFCRSCIVVYLRTHNNCPKCGSLIQKINPMDSIRSDKVLQDIVYKLVPGLFDDEMKRRRDFYKGLYGPSSSSSDDDSSSSSLGQNLNLNGEQCGVVTYPKPFYKPSDSIDLSIEPQTKGQSSTIYYDNKHQSIVTCFTGNPQQKEPIVGSVFSSVDSHHFKTYLRCPARFNVTQLKKFITAKFNVCRDDTVHLLYLNESLKDGYSLIDVAYIYDWRGIEHMRLFYIIERDLSSSSLLVDKKIDGQSRAAQKVTRQSVGVSTQPMKKVCIDPQPRYYEERNNNSVPIGKTRSAYATRTADASSSANTSKQSSSQLTQTPIIRITGATGSSKSMGVNGVYHFRESSTTSDNQKSSQKNNVYDRLPETSKDDQKETRTLRNSRSSGGAPKITIGPDRHVGGTSKSNQSQVVDKVGQNHNRNNVVAITQSNITQLVPYTNKAYASRVTAPAPNSLVTLASFTEARSNHVMATVSSASATAATISDSYRNIIGASSSIGSNANVKGNPTLRNQPTPQLAFSFVTERGITIVRRINSQNEPYTSLTNVQNSSGQMGLPALPRANNTYPVGSSSTSMRLSQTTIPSTPTTSTSTTNSAIQQNTNGSTNGSPNRSSDEGSSSRHHIKAKPVYKTFVDPTKLKSPNFKKLGFTARH